jgi:hypothetical protein
VWLITTSAVRHGGAYLLVQRASALRPRVGIQGSSSSNASREHEGTQLRLQQTSMYAASTGTPSKLPSAPSQGALALSSGCDWAPHALSLPPTAANHNSSISKLLVSIFLDASFASCCMFGICWPAPALPPPLLPSCLLGSSCCCCAGLQAWLLLWKQACWGACVPRSCADQVRLPLVLLLWPDALKVPQRCCSCCFVGGGCCCCCVVGGCCWSC